MNEKKETENTTEYSSSCSFRFSCFILFSLDCHCCGHVILNEREVNMRRKYRQRERKRQRGIERFRHFSGLFCHYKYNNLFCVRLLHFFRCLSLPFTQIIMNLDAWPFASDNTHFDIVHLTVSKTI